MASINKVILIGNLGRDPETRYTTDGGTAITTLNIATTRRYRNAEGQTVSETEWHRVVLFSRLAEIAKEYLHKGSQCYIEGRLRTRKYQAKDGTDRYATEIIGETMQLLDRRQLVEMGLPVLHHWYIYLPAVLIGFAVMMKPIIWAERNRKVASLLRMNVLLLAVVFVLFSFLMHSVWEVAFLVTLFFIGFNILEATLPGLISRTAPKADKGLALGIYNTTQSFGLFVGGAAGGWIAQHFSSQAVFYASSFAMLCWFLLALGLKEPKPRRQHEQGEAIQVR